MPSKEALENLVYCKQELKCKECKHKSHCTMERDYNIIKQALERLEELEKENELLKEEVKPYRLWNEIAQDTVESFRGICLNGFNIQYIRNSEKYFGSEMAVVRGTTLKDLMMENAELKKAIETTLSKLETFYQRVSHLRKKDICDCIEELTDRLADEVINK